MEKTIHSREYAIVRRLLREAREEAGVTQVELAAKLEQTQSYVSKIERGELRIDIIQLRTICNVLGISFPDFTRRLERELRKDE